MKRFRMGLLECGVGTFAIACSIATSATSAFAQDNRGGDQSGGEENEIIVTALRSESALSQTPVAVAAIRGEELRSRGIVDPIALGNELPSTQINANNGGLQISIRGVSSADNSEVGDPSASFNLNGIYIARPYDQLVGFYDIERIEALRGPQGTLYGRNSNAGAINVITVRPTHDFEGYASASYGSYDHVSASGAVNIPVGDRIAFRLAANYDRRDGWSRRSAALDQPNSLQPSVDTKAVRLSASFDITENLSLYVIGDYAWLDGVGEVNPRLDRVFQPEDPTLPFSHTNPPVYLDRSNDQQLQIRSPDTWEWTSNNWVRGVQAELNWELPFGTLTYDTSFRGSSRDEQTNLYILPAPAPTVMAPFVGDFSQESHELRFAFGNNGPLHGQVGLFHFNERSTVSFSFVEAFFGPPGGTISLVSDPVHATSKAVFGQVTYDVTPDLHFTAGGRYSNDEKSRQGCTVITPDNTDPSFNFCDPASLADASLDVSKFTWRLGADYDSNLGLIYASVSTGYKAGGFNGGCEIGTGPTCTFTAEQLYYDPETITAYEAGFRFRLLDNQLRLNGTIFHYDYSGLQFTQAVGGPPALLVTENAARAKVDGIELEAIARVSDRSTLSVSANFLDARYSDYLVPFGAPGAADDVSFNGLPLDRAPDFSATVAYNYVLPLGGDYEVDFGVRSQISSSYAIAFETYQFYQPSFTKTDFSATFRPESEDWSLQFFVRNVENQLTLGQAGAGNFNSVSFLEPRVFGVRAGVNF